MSNRFLAKLTAELNARLKAEPEAWMRRKKFFFAASVNPNRKDWPSELEYVIQRTEAVALKLIPSVQHIDLLKSGHDDFYGALASSGLPLLCHVGPEYAFPEGLRHRTLDDFRHLERPLEQGVTVIAAHCATPVFPIIDKNDVREFHAFMENANAGGQVRLWADTSALSMTTRIPLIPQILDLFSPDWLVHGSDFPIPIGGWAHLPWVTHNITPEEYVRIRRTKNALDRDVRIKRAMGFSDSILENAGLVLRLRGTNSGEPAPGNHGRRDDP